LETEAMKSPFDGYPSNVVARFKSWHSQNPHIYEQFKVLSSGVRKKKDTWSGEMRRPKTNDESEWFIKKEIKQILTGTQWKSWMPNAGVFGRGGVSDFLAVKQPRLFMVVEAKFEDAPTQLQLDFLKMIHDAGHYAFVVDETNLEEFRNVLIRQHRYGYHNLKDFNNLVKWQNQNLIDIQISKT
jgi:hypothetical protein